jgi:hypothetical protein
MSQFAAFSTADCAPAAFCCGFHNEIFTRAEAEALRVVVALDCCTFSHCVFVFSTSDESARPREPTQRTVGEFSTHKSSSLGKRAGYLRRALGIESARGTMAKGKREMPARKDYTSSPGTLQSKTP